MSEVEPNEADALAGAIKWYRGREVLLHWLFEDVADKLVGLPDTMIKEVSQDDGQHRLNIFYQQLLVHRSPRGRNGVWRLNIHTGADTPPVHSRTGVAAGYLIVRHLLTATGPKVAGDIGEDGRYMRPYLRVEGKGGSFTHAPSLTFGELRSEFRTQSIAGAWLNIAAEALHIPPDPSFPITPLEMPARPSETFRG